MKYEIPVRQVKVFESEDGRKVEEHTKQFSLTVETEPEDIDSEDVIYIGVAGVDTPVGAQEIKFPIEAKSLKEAFENFTICIEAIVENAQSSIVAASQSDMDIIENISPTGIIQP